MASETAIGEKLSVDQHSIRNSFDAFLTWMFGIIMLVAAIPHWENPYYFLGSVYAYKLVDPGIGQAVAMILPLVQFVVAICMITRIYVNVSHLIVMVLFCIFVTVQSFAYFGGLDISCGCFGPQHSSSISVRSLVFVGSLFLLSVIRNSTIILLAHRARQRNIG